MKRDSYVDMLKGILILLVIVGHTIANVEKMTILFNFIYSFHIPFLIFLSGYVEEKGYFKYSNAPHKMLLARVQSILIPYLIWVLLDYIRNYGISIDKKLYFERLMGYSETGMWFLAVLFGMKCMHYFFWELRKKICNNKTQMTLRNICLALFLEIVLLGLAYVSRWPYLTNMLSYAVTYFLGVFLICDENMKKVVKSRVVVVSCLMVYIIGLYHFSFYDVSWTTQIMRIALSCCMIIVVMNCKEEFLTRNIVSNALECLGKKSMVVYLLHWSFIDYGEMFAKLDSGFVAGMICFLMAVLVAIVCVFLGEILCRLPYMGRVLFGIRDKRN